VADGLGPVFNDAACANCINTPGVGGTSETFVTGLAMSPTSARRSARTTARRRRVQRHQARGAARVPALAVTTRRRDLGDEGAPATVAPPARGVYWRRMSTPHTVVIVNPKSQGGAVGRRWPELAEIIGRALPFEEVRTSAPGDATELTRQALRGGASCVVALGGDGTVNEVVGGFFDEAGGAIAPEATFALLPYGTGGDFRRTMNIPKGLGEAAKLIAAGGRWSRRRIDLGRLQFRDHDGVTRSRTFANIASFGVSGVVDRLVNESGKKLGGRLSFALATARAAWSYKNQRVELVFDEDAGSRVELTINTVAVANGRYFGGGMMVAPEAEVDDGRFDVVAMGDFGFGDLVRSGRRLYRGTHLTMDKVSHRRARVVEALPLDAGADVELDVDGENLGRLPARFEVLPAALWMAVPPG
jgi:diacylglycerol kinase (ATP)